MQVQLLVERGQDECIVKLAGTAYKFVRNEHGHLVSDITDYDDIKWVSDPHHNTAFKAYSVPKKRGMDEVVDVTVVTEGTDTVTTVTTVTDLPVHEQVGKNAHAPHVGQVDETTPPYPQKGSKRPLKRSES